MLLKLSFLLGCLIPSAAIAFYDYKDYRIPNKIVLFMAISGCLFVVATHNILSGICGLLVFAGFHFIGWRLGVHGAGDVKFAAVLGLWFGLYPTLMVLILSSFAGAVWGLAAIIRAVGIGGLIRQIVSGARSLIKPSQNNIPTLKYQVPLGACMAAASWAVWLGILVFQL
ncbi:MAG: prepilin peptidase [Firmicutes bacterium]|nr:prepilin peptidase [Bacillota bacterium]